MHVIENCAWHPVVCMVLGIVHIVGYLKPNLIADKKTKPLCRCLALSARRATPSSVVGVPEYLSICT